MLAPWGEPRQERSVLTRVRPQVRLATCQSLPRRRTFEEVPRAEDTVALTLLVAGMATGSLVAPWTKPVVADDDKKITLRDDCDPTDPGWNATGGCKLERGDVNEAEFRGELMSPLSLSVIGHRAWRLDPSYRKVEADETLSAASIRGCARS
jgi:hypothetical protein